MSLRPVPNEPEAYEWGDDWGTPPPEVGTPSTVQVGQSVPVLVFQSLAEVADQLRNAPAPSWLVRGLWPADAYGIFGAEEKAGKTWAALDLAVAVAAGGHWLGCWPVDEAGPVLVFAGEGSPRKMLRRLHAVGRHQHLNAAEVEALPIRLCHRVPTLTNGLHLAEVLTEVQAQRPRLVILDPLYLATGEVESGQLNKMGAALGAIQHVTQQVGAALVVVHHWNKTGEGGGRKRLSGAGPAAWGRVLVNLAVIRHTTDPAGRSVVDLRIDAVGDEIPEHELTIRRTVWAEDPDDLTSAMHYEVERTELDPANRAEAGEWHGPTECIAAMRQFFTDHPDEDLSKRATASRLRALGLSYRDTTVADALERLAIEQFLAVSTGARNARLFRLAQPGEHLEL